MFKVSMYDFADRYCISSKQFYTEIEHPQNSYHKLTQQLARKVVLEHVKKQERSMGTSACCCLFVCLFI